MMSVTRQSRGVVLRKIDGWLTPLFRFAGVTYAAPPSIAGIFTPGAIRLLLMLLLAALMLAALFFAAGPSAGFALATAPAATTRDLATILREMKEIQTTWAGKEMPQNVGEKWEALAKEGKSLQDAAERDKLVKNLETFSREVPDPALPGSKGSASGNGEHKGGDLPFDRQLLGGDATIGHMSIGAAVVASPEYQQFLADGAPRAKTAVVSLDTIEVGDRTYRRVLVPVTAKMAADIRARIESKAIDAKAVPTIGANVIEPQRVPGIFRTTEMDRLRLRDVLNVSQTGSNLVEFVTETSYTRAATEVAEGVAKPEATIAFDTASAPVRTIAVWMPVTNQQLQDVPQIQNLIDVRLRYDVDKEEEEQVMYGSGAGQELQGILPLAGVPAITRTVTNTQNLDRIRIGATDVMIAGYEPNAVSIHPIDWEGIVLLKGTDNRYIWIMVTDPATGNGRIWGLNVVETVAMKNPANLQRYLLVGDYRRGATLWDRQQMQVTVGLINDQLIKNMRTILAEKRVAFGIHSPKAFAKYETATAV